MLTADGFDLQCLAELLPAASRPHRLTILSAEELAAASGRRRVMRYVVDGLDAEGPVALIAKVFTERRRAQLLYEHLHTLSRGPFVAGRLRVPEPLAFVPDHNLVWYRPDGGVPLSQVSERSAAVEGVRDAARWLARLHASGVRLPRRFDFAREVISTRSWADVVAEHDSALGEPAHRLAARWATGDRPAPPTLEVPIHKDFHPGHVLIGDGVCVIDLDEARHGDPAFDLAHFCTYLEWQSDQADDLRLAFLAEYVAATGWVDRGAFTSYSAYTWLKIAKQLATRRGPGRARRQGDGSDVGDAIARGIACLDR